MTVVNFGDLSRIESLGLNCELGFVLESLGNKKPALLKWAWTPPSSIIKLCDQDFAGLYDPEALAPIGHNQVIDKAYDILFHSNVKTEFVDGGWRYSDPDEQKRLRIFGAEQNLILAQAGAFRQRFETPETVYVVTRPHHKDYLHYLELPTAEIFRALRSRSGDVPFTLLEVVVSADDAMAGRVENVADSIYRGYVRYFAPFHKAREVDLESWTPMLKEVLHISASAHG